MHPEPAAPQKAPPAQHAALLLQPHPEDQLRPRGLGRIPRTPALAKTLLQLGNQICPQPWVPAPIPIPRGPGNIAHKDPVSTCRSWRLAPLCPGLMPPHYPPPNPLLSSCRGKQRGSVVWVCFLWTLGAMSPHSGQALLSAVWWSVSMKDKSGVRSDIGRSWVQRAARNDPPQKQKQKHSLAPSVSHTWSALRGGLWGLEMPKARASAMTGPKE